MAIVIAIVLTAVLAIFGFYVGLIAIIAPIIAGIVVGYAYTSTTGDGAINGGIGAGIGGLIYTILAYFAFASFITAFTVLVPTGANFAVTVIGALIIDFILGAIGGVIGVLIKGESAS
jgi:hypothetical protein